MTAIVTRGVVEVSLSPALAYPLFAVWLLVGLYVYERTGSRLGGVLVLPFLLLYTFADAASLPLFAVASVAAFAAGEVLQRRTLLYGRRLLVAFLLISLVISGLLRLVIPVDVDGVFLPILPGLFAYNLHREGRPVWGSLVFTGWLLVVLGASVVVVQLVRLTLLDGA